MRYEPRKTRIYTKSRNGELIEAAVDRGFDVLITADKRMRKQEKISGLPLRVVVLTRPYWPSVKTHAERIRKAVEGAEPGRFTTVRTAQTDTNDQSAERAADAQKPGRPAGISGGQEQGKDRLRQGRIVFHNAENLSRADREREEEESFVAARRAHPAIESAINGLEHRGLDRVRSHGADGFARTVALSVLAANLHRIGLILQKRERKRQRLVA